MSRVITSAVLLGIYFLCYETLTVEKPAAGTGPYIFT